MRYPNFLIIGAPKAGTTSLYHYLQQHPDIQFAEMKEPKFFSFGLNGVDFRGHEKGVNLIERTTITDLTSYLQLFNSLTAKNIGEASPNYFHFKGAEEKIYEFIPDVRMVLILRNPIERIYSDWKHNVRMGWEPVKNFKRVLEITPKRMECKKTLPYYDYLNKGCYASHLKRFYKFFKKEQIKIIFYEDFKKETNHICNEIISFLGIDQEYTFRTDKVYMKSNFTPKSMRLFKLTKRIKKYSPRLTRVLNFLNSIPEELGDREKIFLFEYYKDEIEELEKLIGRNLPEWKI